MWEEQVREARILIVDDEPANNILLERILKRAGYSNVISAADSRQAVPLYSTFQPDIILLDLNMPHLDGFAVMAQLQGLVPAESYLPILVLTADTTSATKQRALASGAMDFLTKPFDQVEVQLRLANLLQTRFLSLHLEERVRERTEELEAARLETLQCLALAAELRDDDTAEHTQRVGEASAALAQALGLPEPEVELIRQAAPLHDLGKIGISDAVLLKPGKLTPEEFAYVKTHTQIGASLLAHGRSPAIQLGEMIARTHHERWDGSGYAGLAGTEIPLVSRIVTVADVYDALTHQRPYKPAWPVEEAVAEILAQSGRQFDPDVVVAFLRIQDAYAARPG